MKDNQIYWIIGIAVLILAVVFLPKVDLGLFSTYQIAGRSCDSWLASEINKGYIEAGTTDAPFCWLKDGRTERWVYEMTRISSPSVGCKMVYTVGCDVPDCSPGEIQKHVCPDGTKVDWCECDAYGDWGCIDSPESQCPEEETWTLTSTKSCSEWTSAERDKGYIIGENVPFCWLYLGTTERWILEANSNGGCQMTYNQGCEELSCIEYCDTLTHSSCVGSWEITGSNYPNCGCNWICDCIPETCSSLDKECDSWDNGCGGTLNCGSCSSNYICSGGLCVLENTCTDTCNSLGYECGTYEICGESTNCGSCGTGENCENGLCASNGVPSFNLDYVLFEVGGVKVTLLILLMSLGGLFAIKMVMSK